MPGGEVVGVVAVGGAPDDDEAVDDEPERPTKDADANAVHVDVTAERLCRVIRDIGRDRRR